MKIKYLKDYVNEYGRGRKGTTAHVSNSLGAKLIRRGLAKQVEEERIHIKGSSKDAPIREPEKIELPEEAVPDIDKPAEEEKPKESFLAKILKL